jgi:hypothetical protein
MDRDLLEQVMVIRQNAISPRSRAIYNASNVKYLRWLYEQNSDLLTDEFIAEIENEDNNHMSLKNRIKSFLSQHQIPPLNLTKSTVLVIWVGS